MQNKNFIILLILLLFVNILGFAEEEALSGESAEKSGFWDGVAKPASFGRPFWADMHSTLIRVEAAYATNSPDYDWGGYNSDYRFFLYANLGVDIPIWSGNFKKEKYGLAVTLPFVIDTWYDRFEPETSPIINASYRFGIDTNFIYRLDSPLTVFPHFSIYNWTIRISPLKHESTHLGDELTIRRKNQDLPIARIDVLTNYFEFVFTLNDPDRQGCLNHGFKFGFLFNYEFKNGWYTVLESELGSEADPNLIGPAKFPFEFYLQYQFQSPLFSKGFQIIASAEYRIRERFNYGFIYSGSEYELSSDKRIANCINIFAGIRYDNQKPNYFSKIGIGARYYFGINPYGQFRSMPRYHQVGLAFIFE